MNGIDLLVDAYGRVSESVHRAVEGLSAEDLSARVDAEANSIGWLVWHLTRVQDDHVADVAQTAQVWTSTDWPERFTLPFDRAATGYGHTPEQVAAVRVASVDLLTGYHDAVHERTIDYLHTLTDADLDRVVDSSWDPPVTLGARLISVIADDLQHAGQAAFARGMLQRR